MRVLDLFIGGFVSSTPPLVNGLGNSGWSDGNGDGHGRMAFGNGDGNGEGETWNRGTGLCYGYGNGEHARDGNGWTGN